MRRASILQYNDKSNEVPLCAAVRQLMENDGIVEWVPESVKPIVPPKLLDVFGRPWFLQKEI